MKIVLLDLNATLVENTHVHQLPSRYNVHLETYRSWLIQRISGYYVILMTVRPEAYREATLERLMLLERWAPAEAHFSPWLLKAPKAKERLLLEKVYPRWGRPGELGNNYVAIESNSATRAMYERHEVRTYKQEDLNGAT